MAVVHQSSATANGTGTSVTINKPTGTTAGDLLLAVINPIGGIASAPAGWTLLASNVARAYYLIAGSSEPASYTWTQTNGFAWAGGISRYSGVDNVSPIDVAASTASGSGATAAVPGVTTTSANAMVIGGMADSITGTAITPPASLTERFDLGPGGRVEHASAIQAAAGATGTKTWTVDSGAFWGGFVSALRDANAAQSIVTPTFIASAEQVYQPAVVPTQYVNANFIPSAEAVYQPQVLTTGQIGPNFIGSAEQVYQPQVQVTAGPQATTPNFVGSSEQVFAPAVLAARQITPVFVPQSDQVFQPVVGLVGLAPARVKAAHGPAVSVVVDHEPTP